MKTTTINSVATSTSNKILLYTPGLNPAEPRAKTSDQFRDTVADTVDQPHIQRS